MKEFLIWIMADVITFILLSVIPQIPNIYVSSGW